MKTSLTKLSSSFLLLSLSFGAWARPVAQVQNISGTVFLVTEEGQTSALKASQNLNERSEILVEEGASITLTDYYDTTYHLLGGSHLKFFNKSVQLKKGKTWIQSKNSKTTLALTTANGHVNFAKSEFITTFDQTTNRSQVLVVNGEVEVSNIFDQNQKFAVQGGTFTMVDPEVENGTPRSPTRIGVQSLESALAEFKQLPESIKTEASAPARGIASEEAPKAPVKKGEIIYITSHRTPASVPAGTALKYYKKLVRQKQDLAPVPIKIYGTGWKSIAPETAPRTPASIQTTAPVVPKMTATSIKNDPEFVDSLKKQEIQQPKYSKELESLIQDLKSY